MLDPGRRAESTSSGALASAAIRRGATSSPTPSGIQRLTVRCGRRPPAVVAISATPETRLANSSGCRSAKAMIDMPPIEWPTRTTLPFGATVSMTRARSSPSWSMVACSRSDALGAAVRALVVERHPVLAAERLALEVPAVEVEGVAVREDERHVVARLATPGGLRVGVRRQLVDLGVQHDTVVAGHLDGVGAQHAEPVGLRGAGLAGT